MWTHEQNTSLVSCTREVNVKIIEGFSLLLCSNTWIGGITPHPRELVFFICLKSTRLPMISQVAQFPEKDLLHLFLIGIHLSPAIVLLSTSHQRLGSSEPSLTQQTSNCPYHLDIYLLTYSIQVIHFPFTL